MAPIFKFGVLISTILFLCGCSTKSEETATPENATQEAVSEGSTNGATVETQWPTERRQTRLYAYVLHMNQLQSAVLRNDVTKAEQLLNRYVPKEGEDDLRGFEWYYWSRKLHGEIWSLPASMVDCIAISPDGKLVAAPSTKYEDSEYIENGKEVAVRKIIGRMNLIDAETAQVKASLKGFAGQCTDIQFSPDGSLVACSAYGETIWLFDTQTGENVGKLSDHPEGVSAFDFLPEGNILVSGDYAGNLRTWDWKAQKLLTVDKLPNCASSLTVSPDGKQLAIVYGAPGLIEFDAKLGLQVIDVKSKNLVWDQPLENRDLPDFLQFTPDSQQLLAFQNDGKIQFHSTADGNVIHRM
ncbi:MAG: hypothetical protein KDA84_22445, partial [Planctomycetaceae bacterium]|nr:hypothetical protein [Planctomycetaceae bacterium]